MIYGILITFYVILCLLLILIILIQKGKSSIGLGALSGGSQMLFGGSGGQDLFQKLTWIFGIIFMGGSLLLALMKARNVVQSQYVTATRPVPAAVAPISEIPETSSAEEILPVPSESETSTESTEPSEPLEK